MINYKYDLYLEDLRKLSDVIIATGKKYRYIYAVVRGGCILGKDLSERLHIPFVVEGTPSKFEKVLVVDDVIDSGATRQRYKDFDFACLHIKQFAHAEVEPSVVTYVANSEKISSWVSYWWEGEEKPAQDSVVRFFQSIGEDPSRVGLVDTPTRVVNMWEELYKGYDISRKPKLTVFPNGLDGVSYEEMIVDTGYFFSHCEHHIVPFFGNYYFAYIPGDSIIGLSKVARIVDYYSSRLQVQERLGKLIVDELEELLKPQGIALVLKARHLCKEMRGVKKVGGEMITSDMRGVFSKDSKVRNEFLQLGVTHAF